MLKKNSPARHGLNIIIVGCGKVGTTLVQQLCKEGHKITIVDKDPSTVQELTNLYDIMGIIGNGASYSVQIEAGISSADLFIAVTASDELNLLCCTIAKRVGDCSAIARVRTPDYSKEVGYLRDRLGLAMIINPELEAAREAARILYLPTALEVNSFAHGQVEMIKFKIPEGNLLDGMTVAHLGRHITNAVLICVVQRGAELHIPGGDFQLAKGDIISFGLSAPHDALLSGMHRRQNQARQQHHDYRRRQGRILPRQSADSNGHFVKIIEINRARCEELSTLLPNAIVINGDGTDEELLKEEGIEYAESVVALTGIDEENVLLTLHARQVSNAKVITKLNRISFHDVISQLDLGSVIYPRLITSEAIIAYVRAKTNSKDSNNIETLYHLFDSRVEAIEFRVEKESAVIGVPLRKLPIRKSLLVAFINRNGRIIIPSGNDCIHVGDTVMVVTTHEELMDIRDILR